MKVAIMQPYIFPYLGYYQLINSVDKFLILDDVNYINKGWINRNRILINGEAQYITFPLAGASQNKHIKDLYLIDEKKWKEKIEKTVFLAYKKAPCFNNFFPVFRDALFYEDLNISKYILNSLFLVFDYLNIKKDIIASTSIFPNVTNLKGKERIINLCKIQCADEYINPLGGVELYDRDDFHHNGLVLKFLKPNLVQYNQLAKTFIPWLSMVDLLMHCDIDQVHEYLQNYELV